MKRRRLLSLGSTGLAIGLGGCSDRLFTDPQSESSPTATDGDDMVTKSETKTATVTETTATQTEEAEPMPSASLPETDWPLTHYDAANTSYVPAARGEPKPIDINWRYTPHGNVVTTPLVADDTVFFASSSDEVGHAYAVAAETGRTRWHVQTGLIDTLAIGQDTVFAADSETLYALRRADGQRRWTTQIGDYITAPITVRGESIYVGSSMGNAMVSAVETWTGMVTWTFENTDPNTSAFTAPAVVGDTVYVTVKQEYGAPMIDGRLFALNAHDGSQRWQYNSIEGTPGWPVVANGMVYVSGKRLHAIDRETGQRQWRFDSEAGGVSSPLITDEHVFITDNAGRVYQLDVVTGTKQQEISLNDYSVIDLIGASRTLYLGGEMGRIQALEDGNSQSLVDLAASEITGLSLGRGQLFIATFDEGVYAVE